MPVPGDHPADRPTSPVSATRTDAAIGDRRLAALAELRASLGDQSVLTDPDILDSYRRDQAVMLEGGRPAAVVLPTSVEQVQSVIRLAGRHRIPVVPRGAGTGLAGGANAVEGCIVLVTTKLSRILEVNPEERLLTAEAGVLNAEVKRAAAEHGLFYPPDPASYESCTIGGNVATNAGGLCCVRYGVTADHVLALDVVTADGTARHLGRRTVKGVAGLNLAPLFVGSEGVLGVITGVTLRLRTPPKSLGTAAATFTSLPAAGQAILALRTQAGDSLTLLEIMDGTTIDAVRNWKNVPFDEGTRAVVIAQALPARGDSAEAATALAGICELAGASDVAYAESDQEAEQLLQSRRLAYPALENQGRTLLDDVCVPVVRIIDLIEGIERIADTQGVTIGVFGHAGDGNLHPTIVTPHGDNAAAARARQAFTDILDLALTLGGTTTGEHGVGELKRVALAAELPPEARSLNLVVKAALDPFGILNPGKALPAISGGVSGPPRSAG